LRRRNGVERDELYTRLVSVAKKMTAEAKWFRDAWLATGKKLDMGKACVRFKKLEDLPLEVIGKTIARVPVKAYCAGMEAARAERTKPRRTARAAR
jgi:hypothetical protein